MSRIGKQPIAVPSGVEVTLDGAAVNVKGPRGQLRYDLVGELSIVREGDDLVVSRANDDRKNRSLHGLTRTLVSNMIHGVSQGFSKDLDIVGVGYRASVQGNKLEILVGYSHPVIVTAPDGITFDVPSPTKITAIGFLAQVIKAWRKNVRIATGDICPNAQLS